MREDEILNLTWDKVDMKNRLISLKAKDIKDKEPGFIPIYDMLYEVLNNISKAIHDPHVFLFKEKPVGDIRTALKEAYKKAEIPYGRFVKDIFVFHDLGHTFKTNMKKAGVLESFIMRVTGNSTREMFDRYNTVDVEDTQKAVDQLQVFM